ncbi:MAG: hypothetical protein KBS95_04715 [Alistipes sp.]|nr:hypothetical protein [Candidatus Alistipes equi]
MKELFVIMLAVITVSAVSAKGWNTGLRIGSGFQTLATYEFNDKDAIEARFGITWYYATPIFADFQVLYYRNVLNTHKGLFLDAGAGLAIGGRPNIMYYGVTPSIKFGYKFSGAPVKIGVDWSPVIGGLSDGFGYFTRGLANVGVSCVYSF